MSMSLIQAQVLVSLTWKGFAPIVLTSQQSALVTKPWTRHCSEHSPAIVFQLYSWEVHEGKYQELGAKQWLWINEMDIDLEWLHYCSLFILYCTQVSGKPLPDRGQNPAFQDSVRCHWATFVLACISPHSTHLPLSAAQWSRFNITTVQWKNPLPLLTSHICYSHFFLWSHFLVLTFSYTPIWVILVHHYTPWPEWIFLGMLKKECVWGTELYRWKCITKYACLPKMAPL